MHAREQDIRRYLVNAIQAGRYPEGSRLPTERKLCESLSVSRSAVRSALAVLEGEGLIFRVAGSGTYVSDRFAEGGASNLARESSPAQVIDARLALEPQLAHLVSANGTASDLDEMQKCVEAGNGAERLEVFESWDAALHESIAVATRNPVVIEAYRVITRARDGAEWGDLKRRSLTTERRALYQSDHVMIVEALRRRDGEAGEAAIRAHLLRVRENMLGY